MSEQDTAGSAADSSAGDDPAESHPREDDRNELIEGGTPVPDPEEELGDAADVPGAD